MSGTHHLRPSLEALEKRAAAVGVYQGPPAAPVQLFLHALVQGVAIVRAAAEGSGAVVSVGAVGRVMPLGRTTIYGKLRVQGATEYGFLVLDSSRYSLKLGLDGPASSTTSTLDFQIVEGKGLPTVGTYSYVNQYGGGTVAVTIAPGTGRVPLSLDFQS